MDEGSQMEKLTLERRMYLWMDLRLLWEIARLCRVSWSTAWECHLIKPALSLGPLRSCRIQLEVVPQAASLPGHG